METREEKWELWELMKKVKKKTDNESENQAHHFPQLWMQESLCPCLCYANVDVIIQGEQWHVKKREREAKLKECKLLAGVGIEMK